jgi:hypothetical protein
MIADRSFQRILYFQRWRESLDRNQIAPSRFLRSARPMMYGLYLFFACCSFSVCSRGQESATPAVAPTPANDHKEEAGPDSGNLKLKRKAEQEEKYSIVTDSDLFSPDRKFEAKEEKDDTTPTPAPKQSNTDIPDLRLVGTLSMSDKESFAFIVDQKNKDAKGKALKYGVGEKLGDYVITNIKSDQVSLQKGDTVAALKLKPLPGKRQTQSKPPTMPGQNTGPANGGRSERSDKPRPPSVPNRGRTETFMSAESMAGSETAEGVDMKESEQKPPEAMKPPENAPEPNMMSASGGPARGQWQRACGR